MKRFIVSEDHDIFYETVTVLSVTGAAGSVIS